MSFWVLSASGEPGERIPQGSAAELVKNPNLHSLQ